MEALKNIGLIDFESFFEAINKNQIYLEILTSALIYGANEHFHKTFGHTEEETKALKFEMLFEDKQIHINGALHDFAEVWARVIQGEVISGEFKMCDAKKRVVWVNGSITPILDDLKKTAKVIVLMQNISELKEELNVRTAIMDLTSIVSEADLKGDILSVNDKFLEVSQYPREELIGFGHNTTRHPDVPKETFKELWATIGRGNLFRGMIKNKKKDGTPYYVDAVIAPLMGPNGKPRKYLGVRYDITEAEIERQNARGIISAIDSSFAYIEFNTNGIILNCNKNFTTSMGYTEEEVKGKPHKMFVDPAVAQTAEYEQFWNNLREGKPQSGLFRRFSKSGKEIWLQAVYAPVFDEMGRVQKIIKLASNTTGAKMKNDAISKAQAVIEFTLDGKIVDANENFLKTVGYDINEVKNHHHRMFCDSAYANTYEYKEFWEKLGRGEPASGRFKRFGKGGKLIWLQATYNPNFDDFGNVCGVTKFGSEITTQVEVEEVVTKLAHEFSESTKNISEKSIGVARGAQSLGATTEEMNATIEELTASINSIAQNAKNTDIIAKSTHEEAEIGSKAIHKAIEAMELISKSSEDISEIVKVISEIASQTNLLAFNAAIEAARAGEHGLGFSVVADEVRKLAERSSQATKEISKLINESVKRVAVGSEISRQAGDAFDKIVTGVSKTTDAITEVTHAAEEQIIAAREISTAIQQVSEEAEKSATASESIAMGTQELSNGADILTQTVAKFKA